MIWLLMLRNVSKGAQQCQLAEENSPRHVILLRVLLHHAPGVVLRHERHHCAADALNPFARHTVRVAIKELGNDFLGQRAVEIRGVLFVLLFDGTRMRVLANREAIRAVVSLTPPAVENAQVQAAVRAAFLSILDGWWRE